MDLKLIQQPPFFFIEDSDVRKKPFNAQLFILQNEKYLDNFDLVQFLWRNRPSGIIIYTADRIESALK